MECFAAGGGDRGFPFASGSPDTSSDGWGAVCPWVGCGWMWLGPPENAGLVSGGPLWRSSGPFGFWCLSTGAGWYAGLPVPHNIVRRGEWWSGLQSRIWYSAIHGCWNTWVRQSRLDYSAVVQLRVLAPSLGTWEDACGRAPASTQRRPHLVERAGAATVRDFTQQDVVGSHESRFRSGAISGGCNARCHRTVFVGRHITWWPWDCGGHLVCREFGDPCRRRHAMLACRTVTAFRTFPSGNRLGR